MLAYFSMIYLEQVIFKYNTDQIFFFHKPSKKNNIHLALPKLYIDNNEIQQSEPIKFLGVFLDKNLA